jgi:hypothetical protein
MVTSAPAQNADHDPWVSDGVGWRSNSMNRYVVVTTTAPRA